MTILVSVPILLAIRILLILLGIALLYVWYKGHLSSLMGLLLTVLCILCIWAVNREIGKEPEVTESHYYPKDTINNRTSTIDDFQE